MTSRRPPRVISSVLGLLPHAVLALGFGGCVKPPAPLSAPSPAAASVGAPLTDEECRAVGEEINKAVQSGDVAALDKLIDWDALYQRSTDGVDATGPIRRSFITGLDKSRTTGQGVSASIVDAVRKGGSYHLVRGHSAEKRRWVLFRLLLPNAGVNYHDFLLARRPDGKVKAVDLYVYLTGEPISRSFQRLYVQAVAQASQGLVDRLTGADQKYVKFFGKLTEMNQARQAGQFAKVLEIYNASPPELRKERSVLLLRLQAAQNLGDEAEYARSIEDYRTAYPGDACVDMLSIDYYSLNKKYRESLECVDRLDRAVGGDPYLQTLRAGLQIEQGDFAAARALLKQAQDAEPGMAEAYWPLVTIALKEKDHDETLRALRFLRDKIQLEIGDLSGEPLYKDFVASPQYQGWIKDRRSDGGDEVKESAGKPQG